MNRTLVTIHLDGTPVPVRDFGLAAQVRFQRHFGISIGDLQKAKTDDDGNVVRDTDGNPVMGMPDPEHLAWLCHAQLLVDAKRGRAPTTIPEDFEDFLELVDQLELAAPEDPSGQAADAAGAAAPSSPTPSAPSPSSSPDPASAPTSS